jgi:hypothetical protein
LPDRSGFVAYSISAIKLKQLYGSHFGARARDGTSLIIRIPEQPHGWPRGGTEAFGLKVELEAKRSHGVESIPAFLKIFKAEVSEREHRTRLLIESELAKYSDYFGGMPFGWLGRANIKGVDLVAHFTRTIPGPFDGGPEDFERLRSNGRWSRFSRETREIFAGELAVAVAGLERAGITHGDISPGNVLVGHSRSGSDVCILCDYDGYYHPDVPRLPRSIGKLPCRPLGSPGYQYPDLIDEIKRDNRNDADIWVQTDRFALGVAICEMMVWSAEIETLLEDEGRGQLLPDSVIASRDVSRLPAQVIDIFPRGFLLLDKALKASGPASMPSPEDWLRVLGLDDATIAYDGRPAITIYRRRGNSRVKEGMFRLSAREGDFGKASQDLASMRYGFVDKKLELHFSPGKTIKRRRDTRLADMTPELGGLAANPGDIYYVDEWEFEVADYVEVIDTI